MCRKLICSLVGIFVLSALWADTSLGFTAGKDPYLMGWWTLDDEAGTVARDSSGNENHGVIYGGPLRIPGQIGAAMQFDGTDDYISCRDSATLRIRDQITIAFWLKTAGFTRNWSTMISKGDSSWRMSRSAETGNSVHMGVNGAVASPYSWFDANKPVTNNEWHHVAGVYDGAQARIYIDGVLEASLAATGRLNENAADVQIGNNAEATGRFLSGALDDVRVYNRALTVEEVAIVMEGYAGPTAIEPSPADGATDVPRDIVLSWTPGPYARTHDVYVGTSFEDVNAATTTTPKGVLAAAGQAEAVHDPAGLLTFGQTYSWRVDEVNAMPDATIFRGPVWSFTVEPYSYPIQPIKATASSSNTPTSGPEKTIDGSGLDAQDRHSTSAAQMWMSKATPAPSWILYEFDKICRLDRVWVWNSNQSMEFAMGNGVKEVLIETSTDGMTWVSVGGVQTFAQASGKAGYEHNTTVSLEGTLARFVRLTIQKAWNGKSQAGLSEVRFFHVPLQAFGPQPPDGATDVALNTLFTWRPGREAATHELYFGADADAVTNGEIPPIVTLGPSSDSRSLAPHQYDFGLLALEYGRTYHWKIDEVNDAARPSTWSGDTWSFTVAQYGAIDDFEKYSNLSPNRVFQTWVDGLGFSADDYFPEGRAGNNTGSLIGYDPEAGDIMERSIVHSGRQSMPFSYNNTARDRSETTCTFAEPQDWTAGAADTLVLHFYGAAPAEGEVRRGVFYAIVRDGAGKSTKISHPDPTIIATGVWERWDISFDKLTAGGVDARRIVEVTLGVGQDSHPNALNEGMLFIDDIWLTRLKP